MSGVADKVKTPLRALAFTDLDGCRVLSEQAIEYEDGAEQRVFRLLDRCVDLSSTSMELELAAADIGERYHVTRARANVLRLIDLPPDARVLEIGAGCGAVTRYLGENCGVVDAVEPMPARARVARKRTADLGNVEVFVGGLEDVPDDAVYDVVMYCGVLEYLAAGSDDEQLYVDVISRSRNLLRPGGMVLCAIENQVGVKYMAGAREDHTSRSFDGLEGYVSGARARTFPRTRLARMFRAAGLEPRFLHLFPDYKATRVAMDDRIFSVAPDIAERLPLFPSVDWWGDHAWQIADESRLWRTLVRAGLGDETANSFLVIGTATKQQGITPWPEPRLAAYVNLADRSTVFGRRSAFVVRSDELWFERQPLQTIPSRIGPLELRAIDEAAIDGKPVVDLFLDYGIDAPQVDTFLKQWAAWLRVLVDAAATVSEPIPIDHAPHNILIGSDGQLRAIDQEWWWHEPASFEDVSLLGLMTLATLVARSTPIERLARQSVEDLVRALASRAGITYSADAWESGRHFVAMVHAHVAPRMAAPTAADVVDVRRMQDEQLSRLVWDVRRAGFAGTAALELDLARHREEYVTVLAHARALELQAADREREITASNLRAQDAERQAHDLGEHAAALRREQEIMMSSRGWRLLERARRILGGVRRS